MIIKETFVLNGKKFVRQYSDLDVYILKVETGEKYIDAVDLYQQDMLNDYYTYVETDEKWNPDLPGEIEP